MFGKRSLGNSGDRVCIDFSQLCDESAGLAQIALEFHGFLFPIDLRNRVGEEETAVVPMPIEDDVPRLHVWWEVVMLFDTVHHELAVDIVPVLIYGKGFLNAFFELSWSTSSVREGLQLSDFAEHQNLYRYGFLQDQSSIFKATRPSWLGFSRTCPFVLE